MKTRQTNPDMLVLLEMCLDAEERCAEREAEAWQKGDQDAIEREVVAKRRYVRLRHSIVREMGDVPAGATGAIRQDDSRPASRSAA